MDQHDAVAQPQRLRDVVQHDDDAPARIPQAAQDVAELQLMGDVEVCCRLVEQHILRLLRDEHGQIGLLPLAAGQRPEISPGVSGQSGCLQRALNGRRVGLGEPVGKSRMRKTAVRDERGDADGRNRAGLRQKGEHPGKRALAILRLGAPIDPDDSLRNRQQAGHRAQQRGLAAAVGPDQRGDRAVRRKQGDVAQNGRVGIGKGEAFHFNHAVAPFSAAAAI